VPKESPSAGLRGPKEADKQKTIFDDWRFAWVWFSLSYSPRSDLATRFGYLLERIPPGIVLKFIAEFEKD
jgi:hypothetical protein